MNLGAFLVVTLVHLHDGSFDLRDYPGLYRRAPLLTLAMAFFLLSLVGIPPFVGFLGKFYVFAAVIEQGMGIYATIGALNAAIAAYYYFKILKVMTIDPAGNEDKPVPKLAPADRLARRLRARQPRPGAGLATASSSGPAAQLALYAGRRHRQNRNVARTPAPPRDTVGCTARSDTQPVADFSPGRP